MSPDPQASSAYSLAMSSDVSRVVFGFLVDLIASHLPRETPPAEISGDLVSQQFVQAFLCGPGVAQQPLK